MHGNNASRTSRINSPKKKYSHTRKRKGRGFQNYLGLASLR
jgi:hypothetical protein